MYSLSALLSIIQISILVHVFCTCDFSSQTEHVRDTLNFFFVVYFGVSLALVFLSLWYKTVTPNMIGLSLYTFAGSLSLYFIEDLYLESDNFLAWPIALVCCGFCSLSTCWWSVYQEKFQNLW
ncbi:MARVEL domain-containing protein [Caenorhabditis elegans]|uniref:MARVEL domain-containing protein n=1 Tax=Caenorhabditis elegans TaxID=6239 RepID=A0A8S4Q9Q4_CAEEL|nr:MARVEL domain-containing protein [Caenorhabditis elegans]CAH2189256.1 MARVEL domain-containing protein [Caenorhabditis elegans]